MVDAGSEEALLLLVVVVAVAVKRQREMEKMMAESGGIAEGRDDQSGRRHA
eukprot:ctg_4184.g514